MTLPFSGATMLLGLPFVFLRMGRMLPGTLHLFLGTFWLLGKGPSFLGMPKWFLGIVRGEGEHHGKVRVPTR